MTLRTIKRTCLMALALSVATLMSGSASADVSDFLGNWINTDPDTSGITRILVTPAGGNQVKVHVFGQCHPTDCDWGVRLGHSYAETPGSDDVRSVTANFDAGFANKLIILRKAPSGNLRFEVLTDFNDGSGRHDFDMSGRLAHGGWPGGGWPGGGWPGGGGPGGGGPSGGGMSGEDCIGFNPATAQIAFVAGAWKFVDGTHWILDFGSNHAAAVQAGHVLSHYHFDEQCFVVRPGAQMTYWKRSGHVPSNGMPGQDCISFNPTNVQTQHVGGAWKVVEGSMWMLDFGANHAAADRAVATIQNYNLNRQCFVARPNPPMAYWLSQ